jgi:hypothetical protein
MSELFYKQLNKDWYYSFLEIENLKPLVQELIELKESDVKRYYVNRHYINILAEDIGDRAPVLFQYLKGAGLDKKFQRLLYSAYYEGADAVHIDAYDPKYCSVSLNIPLTDCENSYTAWYRTDKTKLYDITTTGRDPGKYGQTPGQHFAYLPLNEVEEICRVEVTKPMLVNTTILHRGIVPTLTRTICGIRFNSELTNTEVLRLGIKQPWVQTD